jgi:hypothetical protein
MDIAKEIKKMGLSKYRFAQLNDISPQQLNYYIRLGYENLRLDTQVNITKMINNTKK